MHWSCCGLYKHGCYLYHFSSNVLTCSCRHTDLKDTLRRVNIIGEEKMIIAGSGFQEVFLTCEKSQT